MWPSQLIACHKEEGSEWFPKSENFCDEMDKLNKMSLWCWNYGLRCADSPSFEHMTGQNTLRDKIQDHCHPSKKDFALTIIARKSKCPCFLFILLRNIIKYKDEFFELKIIDKMEKIKKTPVYENCYFLSTDLL